MLCLGVVLTWGEGDINSQVLPDPGTRQAKKALVTWGQSSEKKKLHRLSFGNKNTKCDSFLPPPHTHIHIQTLWAEHHFPKHQLRWVRTVISLQFITTTVEWRALRCLSFVPLSWLLWELECTASMIKNTKEKSEYSWEECFWNGRKKCLYSERIQMIAIWNMVF